MAYFSLYNLDDVISWRSQPWQSCFRAVGTQSSVSEHYSREAERCSQWCVKISSFTTSILQMLLKTQIAFASHVHHSPAQPLSLHGAGYFPKQLWPPHQSSLVLSVQPPVLEPWTRLLDPLVVWVCDMQGALLLSGPFIFVSCRSTPDLSCCNLADNQEWRDSLTISNHQIVLQMLLKCNSKKQISTDFGRNVCSCWTPCRIVRGLFRR